MLKKIAPLAALVSLGLPTTSLAQVVNIDGTDAIFLAGRTDLMIPSGSSPWPGGLARHGSPPPEGLTETLPPIFNIQPGSTVSVVAPATGLVSYASGFGEGELNADGDGFLGLANIDSFGGISGYFGSRAGLVGVFLTDDVPSSNPPPVLDFRQSATGTEFTSLAPGIGQVFHIGDGQNSMGVLQEFVAPANATRFAIGIADAFAARGTPGFYNDNDGGFQITLSFIPAPATGSLALLGACGLCLNRRRG